MKDCTSPRSLSDAPKAPCARVKKPVEISSICHQDCRLVSCSRCEHVITTKIKYYLEMAVFWVVAPCSLVEIYQRFRGPCCLHHQGGRPEDSHLRTNRRENLKSYKALLLDWDFMISSTRF
jgi:hypothetical protein